MEIDIDSMIGKVRTAIDDILPEVEDDFTADTDAEIAQALRHAVNSLLGEVPPGMIEPTGITLTSGNYTRWTREQDGSGYIVLPTDFLRFVSMKMKDWLGSVSDLIERGSDEEEMQRTPWGRGSNTKPRAMLDHDTDEKRIVRYWPGSTSNELELLLYVPQFSEKDGKITCVLRDECEKNIIYRAAYIFLEGKKEAETAEKFKVLSTL